VSVRTLRRPVQLGKFEAEFDQLQAPEQELVLEVLRDLRKAESLPGDDDIDELIPPCRAAGWRRRVPGTALWVYYDVDGGFLELRSIRVPKQLSDAQSAALEEELNRPLSIPYLQPVPDPPPDPEGQDTP
jgi:hypothetical protein